MKNRVALFLLASTLVGTAQASELIPLLGANRQVEGGLGGFDFRGGAAARVNESFVNELDPSQIARRLDGVMPESAVRTRGSRETSIYNKASGAVVLVVTNSGIGSGSLISADGQIITNWHVVAGEREVGVIFKPVVEGRAVTRKDLRLARVLKYDQVADLALLRVAEVPKSATPLPLGTMGEIQVGSDVHAIGHPTGETWTYTKGLVSQLRNKYQWTAGSKFKHHADVIQTQTPINPGNSGGPLLSDSGRLIGVNSFKAAGEALNFAVAVSEVNRFLAQDGNRDAEQSVAAAKPRAGKCEVQELRRGRNKANDADVVQYDVNCDGAWDAFLVIPDDPQRPITLNIDSHDNGKVDIVVMDTDRDGRWDISYHDVDGDGKPDLIGRHPDGTAKASRFEPYLASR